MRQETMEALYSDTLLHPSVQVIDPDPAVVPIPAAYEAAAEQAGRVVRVTYQRQDGGEQSALVYLPFGYTDDQRYDILYLMHGGGSAAECLGGEGEESALKRVLDHQMMNGLLRPMIVVAPSFYPDQDADRSLGSSEPLVKQFPQELLTCLMPAVEQRFSTWAETADREGFRASRLHRAFGGFSMGAVTTWWVFLEAQDCFSVFLPMSGDCWVKGKKCGAIDPIGTAEALAKAVQCFGHLSSLIYVMTGTADMAYANLTPQINAMAVHGDVFNLRYSVCEGARHRYAAVWMYLHYMLPKLWPGKE